jgi:hypothetical protein
MGFVMPLSVFFCLFVLLCVMASAGTVSSGYGGTWNVSRGNQVIIMKTRFKFPKILQICEVEAHIYFGVNNFFFETGGGKSFALISIN